MNKDSKKIVAFYGKMPQTAEVNQIFSPKSGTKYKDAIPAPSFSSLVTRYRFLDDDIEDGSIAYHPVFGDIRMDSYWRFSTRQFMADLKDAESNPAIVAHLIHVNSAGGEAFGCREAFQLIRSLKKPVIGLIDSLACSAGYYLVAGCNKVYASSIFSEIGCIGTMCTFYNDDKMMEDWGYKVHEYYSHLSTRKNKVFNDANDGDGEEYITRFLDPMAQDFIDNVKSARGEISEEAQQGETFYAAEAMAAGLIDGEASMEEVLDELKTLTNPNLSININELQL
ncbi:MAG: S49 family peptidase [Mogibacterium sp.]|nr:S49 family peptidase [Mogibacterium sp.]